MNTYRVTCTDLADSFTIKAFDTTQAITEAKRKRYGCPLPLTIRIKPNVVRLSGTKIYITVEELT